MASQAKLTLRPPPNVEFVQGFPGIPPQLPDRPPASVKGTVELRLGGGSLKAKWVKVELRKVETLPGGGQGNTYIDFIGESPLTVWHAKNEWDELQTHDFPFQIRIPESIPPSIALERGAGIKYELVASVLVKGKKGLLRREAQQPLTSTCPVVIDKHELHSTWPIYAQPESRTRSSEGFTLVVNRAHTCYAPGDRIAVFTLVKNDTQQTTQMRHYEFSLLELVVYRPGPHGAKKNNAQIRKMAIQEAKIPITYNQPLRPAMQAKAELSLLVPPHHTTTTVSWAQRIEVTYILHVKAVMVNGQSLALDLPVTITNWTREQSMNAVRRIGTAPNLSGPPAVRNSMIDPQNPYAGYPQGAPIQPPPVAGTMNGGPPNWNQSQQPFVGMAPNGAANPNITPATVGYNPNQAPNGNRPPDFSGAWNSPQQPATFAGSSSLPAQSNLYDDFGMPNGPSAGIPRPTTMYNNVPNGSYGAPPGAAPAAPIAGGPGRSVAGSDDGNRPVLGRNRPSTAGTNTGGAGTSGRFTIANADPDESKPSTTYVSAEEEKRRIRAAMEEADKRGQQAQGSSALPRYTGPPEASLPSASLASSSSAILSQSASASSQSPGVTSSSGLGSSSKPGWLSAEEEKRRYAQQNELYEMARNNVSKTQGQAKSLDGHFAPSSASPSSSSFSPPPPMPHSQSQWPSAEQEKFNMARQAVERAQGGGFSGGSSAAGGSIQASGSGMSQGRALYQNAISNMRSSTLNSSYPMEGSASSGPSQPYLTAAQEKEQMRYKHAMQAVEGFKVNVNGSPLTPQDEGPIPYDALYSTQPSNSSSAPREVLPLKITRSRSPPLSPPPFAAAPPPIDNTSSQRSPPPLPSNASPSFQPIDARTEKERMRLLYEQQDQAVRQPNSSVAGTAIVPPVAPTGSNLPTIPPTYAPDGGFASRSPLPLPSASSNQPLTAAQEKAMLKAAFEGNNQVRANPDSYQPPAEQPAPLYPDATYALNGTSNGYHHSPPIGYNNTLEAATSQVIRDPSISAGKKKDNSIPPPLGPKPPAEYYKYDENEGADWEKPLNGHGEPDFGPIEVRPFSPFNMDDFSDSLGSSFVAPPPPPPLPPKPQGTV